MEPMTGIENITGRIQADADAEIAQIRQDAAAQVEQIQADYEKLSRQEAEEIVEKGQKMADERGARLVSAAQMEAKKMTLAAKQEVLDEAFALALEKLTKLPEEEYVTLLANLIVKASSTGHEQVILNQVDRARYGVKACVKANEQLEAAGKVGGITLSEQTRPIQGGLLLSSGAVEVNCALETLVRLSRTELTHEVSELLFS
jgi:V/A-type H+-transporting ATPase subunit E